MSPNKTTSPGGLLSGWRRFQQRRAALRSSRLNLQAPAGWRTTIGNENRPFTKPRRVCLANIAEGTHAGNLTKAVDAAITERFLLGKIGGTSARVAVCGAADTPIGVITDEAALVGDLVNVALFGSASSTLRMVASAAIAQGALVEPAANGRVQTLGAGAGTHHVVGRALQAAANAGEVIEVDPHYFLRVI